MANLSQLQKKALSELAGRQAREELARQDLFEFIKFSFKSFKNESWHHHLICDYYERVIKGEIKRLMVFAPPRHMKTEGLERACAWFLGHHPNKKIMTCGYGATISSRISRHVKDIVKGDEFKEIFQRYVFDSVDSVDFWELGGGLRGSFQSAGVGGAITGAGFNLGIIDDPHKSREEAESIAYQEKVFEWYEGTFLNRQDEKDSAIIITMTRWNRKDLAGRLLERDGIFTYNGETPNEKTPEFNGSDSGLWSVLCLPAIMDDSFYCQKHEMDLRVAGDCLWPQRFPLEFLEQFQKNKYNWSSLYQNQPVPRGGNLISRDWFQQVEKIPYDSKLVRFWDLAGTEKTAKNDPDFTAGALVALKDSNFFIVDIKTIRGTPNAVEILIKQTAYSDDDLYGSVTQIWEEEPGAGGKHITAHYQKLLLQHKRKSYRTGKSKEFYVDLFANKAESGNVFFLAGKWLSDLCESYTFFDECEAFPRGSHDDRIDAVAKAMHMLASETQAFLPEVFGESINSEYEKDFGLI